MGFDLSWLEEVTVASIPLKRQHGKKGVVVLDSHSSVVDALTKLVDGEILSAPVWDEQEHAFVGNLDVRDIVNLIAKTLKQHEDFDPLKLIEALSQEDQFANKKIKEVFSFSKNDFFPVTEDTTLLTVVRHMVETGKNHRRALVFAKGAEQNVAGLISLVSQSAVINYIGTQKGKLGTSLNSTINDAWHTNWEQNREKVVSVSANSNMIEAFEIMGLKNISGLAVLDERAQLLGTIGSRDVKGLITNHRLDLTRLRLTTREYINYIRQLSVEEKHPAISVKRTDTVATLVGKFSSTHVHRIFVIDDHNLPIGVISTIDLLRILSGQTH